MFLNTSTELLTVRMVQRKIYSFSKISLTKSLMLLTSAEGQCTMRYWFYSDTFLSLVPTKKHNVLTPSSGPTNKLGMKAGGNLSLTQKMEAICSSKMVLYPRR
jgi:hypothetical protein